MKKTQNKESLFAYKQNGGKGGIYMMLHGKERLVHPYALYEALWNGREKLRLCHGVDARFLKCATEVEGVYSDVAKVTFTPDTFVGGPIFFGWCKKQQVLRALYLGFLRLFVRESKSFDESEHGASWNEYRLMAYNKLQSCIVEDYLMGTDADDLIYHQRQRIVHTVAEMKADYTALVEKLSSIYFLLNLE